MVLFIYKLSLWPSLLPIGSLAEIVLTIGQFSSRLCSIYCIKNSNMLYLFIEIYWSERVQTQLAAIRDAFSVFQIDWKSDKQLLGRTLQ
jgi:hypothetical protein